MKIRRPILQCAGALLASAACANAQSFVYSNFSNTSNLQLNGSAFTTVTGDGTVLRLTPNEDSQGGSAFSKTPVTLADNASFSTEFTFRFTDAGGIAPADGIVFVAETDSNSVGGVGGGIGYAGISNSVGVEFDDFNNGYGEGDEDNGNHVAINFDGNVVDNYLTPVSPNFYDGNLWYAWIDYDGATDDLQVRVSEDPTRPVAPLINATGIDLVDYLGQDSAYVGFTSATGAGNENHDITSWAFNDTYQPIQSVPEASTTWVLLGFALGALMVFGRRFGNSALSPAPSARR
jgi:hypothetical protein